MECACAGGFDWIWLLDDDAIPRRDALAALAHALPGLPPTTGAVCGTLREFGDIAVMHRRSFSPLLGIEKCLPRRAYRENAVAIDTGSFVDFMVSAAAVTAVGLPDSTFFLAYDDTKFSLRLKHAGFGVWLVPASIVDHLRTAQGRLRSTRFGRKHYFNVRNRIVVKKKYAAFQQIAAATACLFGIGLWLRSPGRFQWPTFRVLLQALGDGYRARLGNYPRSLEGIEITPKKPMPAPR